MTRRYFVDHSISGETVLLAGTEAHHLIRVMRAVAGEELILFDGTGFEWEARIESIRRNEVECRITERHSVSREIAGSLTIGVALPKGDRQKWLVEKLVELGVTALVPLQTQRAVAKTDEKVRRRLERGVIEASKQCGRNRLMAIKRAESLPTFLARGGGESLAWFAQPGHPDPPPNSYSVSARLLAVGPEGGWTEEETAQAQQAGWDVVGFGERILRVETACLLGVVRILN